MKFRSRNNIISHTNMQCHAKEQDWYRIKDSNAEWQIYEN